MQIHYVLHLLMKETKACALMGDFHFLYNVAMIFCQKNYGLERTQVMESLEDALSF